MKKISSKQIEALKDLAKQKELIYALFEEKMRMDSFHAHKYHNEEYYEHFLELKKARNILKYILESL